ncbi:MAG TPA: cyclase family protein [Chthoniobacterales bacterium]|nr:cyclase family protein [Chthoniobacterales bacterium]
MTIFDISRPLFNGLAPWPGDTAFRFDLKWKMAEGASVNVGAVQMGVHNGSHADAPAHFQMNGPTIEQLPLETYLGDAFVVDLTKLFSNQSPREIQVGDLAGFSAEIAAARRVLLKTGVWTDSRIFPDQIPIIAPDVPSWLGERKVKLLGLDLPSVDPIDSKTLDNHHALAAAGIAILESLELSGVQGGLYHLSAVPLRITGGDAGPVRAVLWRE